MRCDLQIFSGCVCHLEQLHAQSPFLFPIVFSFNVYLFVRICTCLSVNAIQDGLAYISQSDIEVNIWRRFPFEELRLPRISSRGANVICYSFYCFSINPDIPQDLSQDSAIPNVVLVTSVSALLATV